jgi:hypothetical protein
VNAKHAVLVRAAEEGDAAGFPGEPDHLVGRRLDQGIAKADLTVELDDARPERIALAGDAFHEPGAEQELEVTVGAGA